MAEGKTEQEAEALAQDRSENMLLQAKKNPYVLHLATNPLYLSGLCLVQE